MRAHKRNDGRVLRLKGNGERASEPKRKKQECIIIYVLCIQAFNGSSDTQMELVDGIDVLTQSWLSAHRRLTK